MTPDAYEAWYATPRGRWIGDAEYAMLRALAGPRPGDALLDVGCGTGHFTRRFARDCRAVVGIDPDAAAIGWARSHATSGERYVRGAAETLPFPDRSFDVVASVAAIGFVRDPFAAVREIVRVARRSVVLGLLNRRSLLHRAKGRPGSEGGYDGARWHDASDAVGLLAGLPVARVRLRSAVVLPGGGAVARAIEPHWPRGLLVGAMLAVAADVEEGAGAFVRGTLAP